MIASLAMYPWPAVEGASARLWGGIRDNLRAAGIAAPESLETAAPLMDCWRHPGLVFSQTCGLPWRRHLQSRVQMVATPDYGLAGCPPGHYRSAFLVRARDGRTDLGALAGACFAYNDDESQSGWATPLHHMKARGIAPGPCIATGTHATAARAVAEGRADFAAVDALSWEMIKRYEGFSLDLRVLDWTAPMPGLPYICGTGIDRETVLQCLDQALAALDPADRKTLHIGALAQIPAAQYRALPDA